MGNLAAEKIATPRGPRPFVRCPCGAWFNAEALRYRQTTCFWCSRVLHLGQRGVLLGPETGARDEQSGPG